MTSERTQTHVDFFEPFLVIDDEEFTSWHDIARAAAGVAAENGLSELPGYGGLKKPHAINRATKEIKGLAKRGVRGPLRRAIAARGRVLITNPHGVKFATAEEAQEMKNKQINEAKGKLLTAEQYDLDAVVQGFILEAPEAIALPAVESLQRLMAGASRG